MMPCHDRATQDWLCNTNVGVKTQPPSQLGPQPCRPKTPRTPRWWIVAAVLAIGMCWKHDGGGGDDDEFDFPTATPLTA
eukprot:353494-Chlamydomonas_euryale.AAC.3